MNKIKIVIEHIQAREFSGANYTLFEKVKGFILLMLNVDIHSIADATTAIRKGFVSFENNRITLK